jgi:hypothetical protein
MQAVFRYREEVDRLSTQEESARFAKGPLKGRVAVQGYLNERGKLISGLNVFRKFIKALKENV